VIDAQDVGATDASFFLSPSIDPGKTVTFSGIVEGLGSTPIELVVECRAP
jgi:hypothetical protein